MKRSASVSLVLMASVSAMAALSACGEAPTTSATQPDNGGTFANKAECVAVYDQDTCDAADKLARQEHVSNAPKYGTREQCIAEYGPDMCRPASEYGGASNVFVPMMMGYMLGSAMSTPAPLYYGPGSYRERERYGSSYSAPIYSSGRGYSRSAPIGKAPYVSSKPSISTKGSLKSSTAMTPPASARGGFGSSFKPSTSFKSSYAAQNPSSFGRSTFSSGSSYSGSSVSSGKAYSGSSSFSSRGGFGGSGRSFGGGFGG